MRKKRNIFFTSLVLTVLIFGTAMTLNYSFDFFRLGSILGTIREHEISYEAYLAEESFVETFGGDKCRTMSHKIEALKNEIKEVGIELSSYGRISFFKKMDYDYLERKYFLLELKFLALIENLNRECNNPYIPILFFYESEGDISERQGYILSEISDAYKQQVVVLSIDKDYESEPLIKVLTAKYNVTKSPTIIIANKVKYERLVYEKEIDADIRKLIEDSDFYGSGYDFESELSRTGLNKDEFISNMNQLLDSTASNFARGDINLIMGRITKNNSQICRAVDFYEAVNTSNPEEQAIIYETMASIGCKKNKRELLMNASAIWMELGNRFRARIDSQIANDIKPELMFSTLPLAEPKRKKDENISMITIGASSILLTDEDILVSQTDRVTRDWLGYQINSSPFSDNILTVFSEKHSYAKEELLEEIGWHEGGRIKEIKEIGLKHKIASATIVARYRNKWYAPDEKGIFRFEVPIDKVFYPTTRFLSEDIAVIIDTHGINMLVEQAVRNNATFVIGCGDHPGKIKAAKYLAEKGINVIMFPDKYLPLLLGTDYTILGSPPINRQGDSIIIGGQPISFSANSTIIAGDVGNYTNVQSYYDTPARYFRNMEEIADLNVIYIPLSSMNQTKKITDAAEFFNAEVIGARIFNSEDYINVKQWLRKDIKNKAVLFHSVPYPYGYKLIMEFPMQTTFGDINPILT